MSLLTLIRHARASFLDDDYDKLSPQGFEQARLLGLHLAAEPDAIDAAWIGPLRRHRQTFEAAADAAASAGRPLPDPIVLDALTEHDGERLLKAVVPGLAQTDPEVRALVERLDRRSPDFPRHFHHLFEHVTHRWIRAELDADGVEPWAAFRRRVGGAVEHMMGATGRGQHVVAFTSAGVVGTAIGHVLALDDRRTLELTWMLYNGSLTDLRFSPQRANLAGFNRIPHLPDPAMRTWR